jgi:hypothetical protein
MSYNITIEHNFTQQDSDDTARDTNPFIPVSFSTPNPLQTRIGRVVKPRDRYTFHNCNSCQGLNLLLFFSFSFRNSQDIWPNLLRKYYGHYRDFVSRYGVSVSQMTTDIKNSANICHHIYIHLLLKRIYEIIIQSKKIYFSLKFTKIGMHKFNEFTISREMAHPSSR